MHTTPTRDRDLKSWSAEALTADSELSLFQKVLLCTDGTVTELLSLWRGSPIQAHRVEQTFQAGGPSVLACAGDARILRRTVLLGAAGRPPDLYAQSFFVFERLSAQIQRDLAQTDLPIGLMWRREQLESFREITERKAEINAEVAHLLAVPVDTPLLSRTYRIIRSGMVYGVITEKFASTAFVRQTV